MDSVIESITSFVGSSHGAAFAVGTAAYVVYMVLSNIKMPNQETSSKVEQTESGDVKRPGRFQRSLAFQILLLIVACSVALLFMAGVFQKDDLSDCPAEAEGDGALGASASTCSSDGTACTSDTSAQMEEDEDDWLEGPSQARKALAANVEVEKRCVELRKGLQDLNKKKSDPKYLPKLLAAFRAVKKLGVPFREATSGAIGMGVEALNSLAAAGYIGAADGLEDLWTSRSSMRACMLTLVQEARNMAWNLPLTTAAQKALRCNRHMLADLETFSEAQAEEDKDARARSALGVYWSDIGILGRKAPFFFERSSKPTWVPDAEGLYVPEDIAKSEKYLVESKNASGGLPRNLQTELGIANSLRLYQHAKFLALKQHDEAAHWRYMASATEAAANRRLKLAAHSLTRLSYFLQMRGRIREALDVANAALEHHNDPFALYLQTTLRRLLGELRTSAEVHSAEQSLGEVAGKLPSRVMELHRAAAHTELQRFHMVEAGGVSTCFHLSDVAHILICVVCKLMFPDLDPAPAAPAVAASVVPGKPIAMSAEAAEEFVFGS